MRTEHDIPVRRVDASSSDLPLPSYATEGSAGLDLRAAVEEPVVLNPGERYAVPTGIAIALPPGFEGQIRPRSGLAFRHGIATLNAPGTIDCDYRGEIRVLLVNHGNQPWQIERGDRIAQMVIARYERVSWVEVDDLEETVRGVGGFGSTGL